MTQHQITRPVVEFEDEDLPKGRRLTGPFSKTARGLERRLQRRAARLQKAMI